MRNALIKVLVVIVFLFMAASNTFAATSFNYVYMTSGNGTFDVVTEYGWTELPWLYLQLGEVPDSNFDLTITIWDSPSSQTYWKPNFNPTSQNIWISGDELKSGLNSVDWIDIRELGNWDVQATYATCSVCSYTTGTTAFTVVPEPISSTLFLVGAVTLGFRRFRKIKRK